MVYGSTAHNRIVYASGLKALGLHSARSATPPTPHSGTFLRLRETLRVSFIATAKTSYTTESLGASLARRNIKDFK